MTQLYTILGDELINALGWTFVHSLWQGSLVALIMTAVLGKISSQQARKRYVIATLSLISVLLCSVITFVLLYQQPVETVRGTDLFATAVTATADVATLSIYAWISQFNPFLVSIWIMGVVFFALRFCFGLGYLQHLKSQTIVTSPEWQTSLDKIVHTLGYTRSVRLAQSALIRIPVVTGYLKPVILFPVGIINQLHTDEVEAILAHEVAHLVRNDFVQNLVQSLIEMVFYYHPAVWWISAVVRSERENCCDDLAVQVCSNSFTYAKALVRLEDVSYRAPALALPFAGSKGHLLNRIKRILNQPQNKSNVMERIIATVILIGCVTLLSFTEKNAQTKPETDVLTEYHFTVTDTVPVQRDITVMKTLEGKDIEMRSENGEIKSLKINGEVIEPSSYPAYEAEIEEMKAIAAEAPEIPPIPPMPPAPAVAPVPPVPPMPPGMEMEPMPPMPAMPAMPAMPPMPEIEVPEPMEFDQLFFAPKASGSQDNTTNKTIIVREKSGKGFSYRIESEGPETNVIVDGDRGIAMINGQEIELDADSVIVIEATERSHGNYAIAAVPRFNNDVRAHAYRFNNNFKFDINGGTGFSMDSLPPEWKEYEKQMEEYKILMERYSKQLNEGQWAEYQNQLKDWGKELENNEEWKAYAEKWKHEYSDQWKEYAQELEEYQKQLAETEREHTRDIQERNRELLQQQRQRQTEARQLFRDQTERDRALELNNGDVLLLERRGNVFAPSPGYARRPFGPIISSMNREGLIDADGEYKIILEEDKLRINGKRQPDAVHQKYLDMFRRTQGYAVSGKTKIEISND